MDIVTNVRQTLINIADLPKGFKIIVKYFSLYIESLENVNLPILPKTRFSGQLP